MKGSTGLNSQVIANGPGTDEEITRDIPNISRSGPLWRRWVAVTTAGEVLGFVTPAVAGALTTVGHLAAPAQAAVLVAAGAVEGALLGWAQAIVLRRVVSGLPAGSWIRATALAASLAYAMGMLPSLLFPLPVPAMVAIAAVAGTILLGSIGTAQWLVLRRHRPHTAWWIPVTAAAWLLGLGAFLAIATPLCRPGQSSVVIAAVGVLAATVMAATVAAVTGLAVLRLRADDHLATRPTSGRWRTSDQGAHGLRPSLPSASGAGRRTRQGRPHGPTSAQSPS
jgi:hypothetical protein